MKKQKSVARFIALNLIFAVILYAIMVVTIVNDKLHKGLINYFTDEITSQSTKIADEINKSLDTAESIARNIQLSYKTIYPEYGFDRTIMNSFAVGARNYFGTKNIVFFNSFGLQVSSPKYGVVPKTPVIREVLSGKEVIKLEKDGSDIYATVILPLLTDDVIFGAVEIRTPAITAKIAREIAVTTDCDFTFFDGNKRYITTLSDMEGTILENEKVFTETQNGSSITLQSEFNGHKYLSHYFPLNDLNGNYLTTLFIGKTLDVATIVSAAIFKSLLVGLIIFSILLLADLILLIYGKTIKPLKQVTKAIENLSSGEADLTARVEIKTNDEYQTLADNVNKFIEMLQGIVKELNDSQKSLNEVSENLERTSQESASATSEVLANIESVRKQSQNQSVSVQNTSNVLQSSTIVVSALMDLIENERNGINESSAAIEEMLRNISMVTNSVKKMSSGFKDLNATVDIGKNKLSSVDHKVIQIAEQSKMLIQANTMISQIASETNLLAMNAAIEAAHAGDAGKGFSVVAEEIRKLAENSSVQAKAISTELKQISSSIQDVVSLSNDSQTAFGQIVDGLLTTDNVIQEITNAMDEQQNASRQVFQSLSDMKEQSAEVSKKADDMQQGIQKVSTDMSSVTQISTTILGSMDEMSTGMQQIGNATQDVSTLAETTKDNIIAMNEKLDRFKI